MHEITGLLIDHKGTKQAYHQNNDSLRPMYPVLKCGLVEPVYLTHDIVLWVDEEGLYNHKLNELLTEMAHQLG